MKRGSCTSIDTQEKKKYNLLPPGDIDTSMIYDIRYTYYYFQKKKKTKRNNDEVEIKTHAHGIRNKKT